MSHLPAFQDELAAIEKIMQDNPELKMDFTVNDFDPRDVPVGYEMQKGVSIVWFQKNINKSEIDLFIDKGWINTAEPSLKEYV